MTPSLAPAIASRRASLGRLALLALVVVTIGAAPACQRGSGVELTSEPPAESQAVPRSSTGDGETTTGVNYVIHHPALSLSTGAPGRLELRVTPAGGFKVNTEYPWLLTITAPDALVVERREWDVSAMDHLSEDEAQFTVPVSATAAGRYQVEGHLRFSVCNDARCDTPQASISWPVTVE